MIRSHFSGSRDLSPSLRSPRTWKAVESNQKDSDVLDSECCARVLTPKAQYTLLLTLYPRAPFVLENKFLPNSESTIRPPPLTQVEIPLTTPLLCFKSASTRPRSSIPIPWVTHLHE